MKITRTTEVTYDTDEVLKNLFDGRLGSRNKAADCIKELVDMVSRGPSRPWQCPNCQCQVCDCNRRLESPTPDKPTTHGLGELPVPKPWVTSCGVLVAWCREDRNGVRFIRFARHRGTSSELQKDTLPSDIAIYGGWKDPVISMIPDCRYLKTLDDGARFMTEARAWIANNPKSHIPA